MIKKLRRNSKALSPIFAVLILIAIAVIAGIVVYMFTSGYLGTMMGGGTAGQEKVAIQATQYVDTDTVYVYAKSTGGGNVTITEAILKDSAGNVVSIDKGPTTDTTTLFADGTLGTITCNFDSDMSSGGVYTVTLVSKTGNQFVSPSFKAP